MAMTSDGTELLQGRMLLEEPEPCQQPQTIPPAQSNHSQTSQIAGTVPVEELKLNDQERAVGITECVSPGAPGFNCIIKHRYTDFLVNEILPNGQVVHLTDIGESSKKERQGQNAVPSGNRNDITDASFSPDETVNESYKVSNKRRSLDENELSVDDTSTPRKKQRTEQEENAVHQATPEVPDTSITEPQETPATTSKKDRKDEIISSVPESDKVILRDLFGESTTKSILNLYATLVLHPDRKPRDQPMVRSEPIVEKSKRTEAHVAIRRIFASKLETLTMQDEPGVMSIKAAPTKGPSGARGQPNGDTKNGAYQKGKLGWEQLGGEYLHFTLYKENKDTMEVLYFLASKLKVPIKNFQFAGTKDRRGVTVQRVAIFRLYADQIARLNKFARGWQLGGFEYKKHGLDLGELGGNEFLLTLRDCTVQNKESSTDGEKLSLAEKHVSRAAESFKQNGFLN